MPHKKKSKPNALRTHAKPLLGTLLAVVILAVAYLVISGNHNAVDAQLSAPLGTASRAAQIDTSELNQEQAIDDSFDTQQQKVAGSDSAALQDVGKAMQNAN